MSLVGKPRPGVCGRCGTAVVRSAESPPTVEDGSLGNGHLNGHRYEAGKLVSVRCKAHGGLGFDDDIGYGCFSNLD